MATHQKLRKLIGSSKPPPGYEPKPQLACVKPTKYCDGYKVLFMRCGKKSVTNENYLDISSWSCTSIFGESHFSYKLELTEMKISCETFGVVDYTNLGITNGTRLQVASFGRENRTILRDSCWMRYWLIIWLQNELSNFKPLISDFTIFVFSKVLLAKAGQ